jgi:hypothetical protein
MLKKHHKLIQPSLISVVFKNLIAYFCQANGLNATLVIQKAIHFLIFLWLFYFFSEKIN